MPDLEQQISAWRAQMLAAGVKSPVPLDELESHLRDEIERQIQSGASAQLAFENSVRLLGSTGPLKREFKKSCAFKSKHLLRMGAIGLIGTIVLNFLGIYVFHRGSSAFFSDAWWSAWLPCYLVWTTFTIIGLADRWRTATSDN
jgi:hypothetical protein